jgi:hypothetical protein
MIDEGDRHGTALCMGKEDDVGSREEVLMAARRVRIRAYVGRTVFSKEYW